MSTLRTTTLQDVDSGQSVDIVDLVPLAGVPAKITQTVQSIAQLKTLDKNYVSKYAETTGYYTSGDGGNGTYYLDLADVTTPDNGGTVIVANDGGRWKLVTNSSVNLRQFGAKGDNATDDTAAVTNAAAYIVATGRSVQVPAGVFLTDPITINSQTEALQGSFFGVDRQRCILKRRTTGSTPFITIGSVTGTAFQTGGAMYGLTIDGGVNTNGPAFRGYDLVRSVFTDMRFKGGQYAVSLLGGISVAFNDCLVDQAQHGYHIDKFTSLAGGGWPNIIRIRGGEVVDNTVWGIWFDGGRMLLVDECEVEGNGTTLGQPQGGIYIGPNIGQEISVTDATSIGLVAKNCWFEANKGAADCAFDSGINTIDNSTFFSNSASVTNAVSIAGGRYYISECNFSTPLTTQISEGGSVLTGNIIRSSDVATYSLNYTKTSLISNNVTRQRDGYVPVVTNYAVPTIQTGSGNTGGAGVSVSFPVAYATIPHVVATVNNGDSTTTINNVVISSITTSGFFARGLTITSGSSTVTQTNLGFNWTATGTK